MECPCGATCKDVDYAIKLLKNAKEWDETVEQKDLPVRIYGHRCPSCGRQLIKVIKNESGST